MAPFSASPTELAIIACRADDASVMELALSQASPQHGSLHCQRRVIGFGVENSVAHNAPRVLEYLIEQGADLTKVSSFDITRYEELYRPPLEVLELLIAHGWDIDTRGPSGAHWPLLWCVVSYDHLVAWCLNRGASVTIPDGPLATDTIGTQGREARPIPTITEMAAAFGIVSTFQLLREKIAPLGRRTLHRAVEQAAALAPIQDAEPSIPYTHRMCMIRHLLDVEKLDVNTVELEPGTICSTPLCYPAARATGQDMRELTRFLLDRGADPQVECGVQGAPSAMECARVSANVSFLEAVREKIAADNEALRRRR